MNWRAYISNQNRPALNLAWEDGLLEGLEKGSAVFFLYSDAPCVVIGRNQNPWREAAAETGFPVFRRKSGGGAVYHDDGNLNWSFLLPRDEWSVQDALDFVRAALRGLGVDLESDSRGALFLRGRKVCGTARRFFRSSVLIHGTLLVSSDLDALRSSLGGLELAENRAIASVPSPVGNLSEAVAGITTEKVREALYGELSVRFGTGDPLDPARTLPSEAWSGREAEHSSWEWVYGSTMPFSVPLGSDGRGPYLLVREGRVQGSEGNDHDLSHNPALEPLMGRFFDIDLLRTARLIARGSEPSPEETLSAGDVMLRTTRERR